ncbi:MAG: thioredoxin fold domain-containing protein [Balneolales bacterium]|nr:thioredoxin fold domain-containing protein [Balneolales bacterium]
MRRYATFILTIFLFIGCSQNRNHFSMPFSWVSMEEAQNNAQLDGKKILVNVYTDWCEYCKKMDATVYKDSLIKNSISTYYHSVRINADSEDTVVFNGVEISQHDLARKMGIRSYPTILFLDNSGDLILQINGFMPIGDFKNMITFIGEDIFHKTDFHEFASGEWNR